MQPLDPATTGARRSAQEPTATRTTGQGEDSRDQEPLPPPLLATAQPSTPWLRQEAV